MAMEVFTIRRVTNDLAQSMVVKYHYLHRKAPCSVAFGLFDSCDYQVGVIMYGTPSSAPLREGICGPEEKDNVCELVRLWTRDDCPRNSESYLIGNTIKKAPKPIIVSFADPSIGHIGIVYQATNWIYTGLSAKRTNWKVEGIGVHSQTLADRSNSAAMRDKFGDKFSLVDRARKHRYVYFVGPRAKELRGKLRYPVMDYPKSDKPTIKLETASYPEQSRMF